MTHTPRRPQPALRNDGPFPLYCDVKISAIQLWQEWEMPQVLREPHLFLWR
jgi:hypothetical protein